MISLYGTARVTVPDFSIISHSKQICACSPVEKSVHRLKVLKLLGTR